MKLPSAVILPMLVASTDAFSPTSSSSIINNRNHQISQVESSIISRMTTTSSSSTTTEQEQQDPRQVGLAFMLDDGTRKSHSLAQNTAFVGGFFKGLSAPSSYSNLLTSLYFVYSAMEESFDSEDVVDIVRKLDDPELRRVTSLEKDMDYFYGREWRDEIEPSPATVAYVSRVEEVAEKKPYLLVAHQYTRYLGDLFGGQMMSGMATRSLDLEEGMGVDFYTFEDIGSVKDFITDWYTRLNALELTEEQKAEIVDEANFVFDLNIGILEELEGSPIKAIWTLALNSFKLKLGLKSS